MFLKSTHRVLQASLLCLACLSGSCQKETATSGLRAFQATDRGQLFGGARALGDVGDYVLMNDKIRAVIQNAGFSRGFGVYGGGIIDADIRRTDEQGRGEGQLLGGHDIFAEMFSSFFFEAMACDKVEVLSDGGRAYDKDYGPMHVHYDAGVAVVRASGGGGEFLTMLRLMDSIFVNFLVPTQPGPVNPSDDPALIKAAVLLNMNFVDFAKEISNLIDINSRFEVDYVLKPGASHIEIHSRIINQTSNPLDIPSALLSNPEFSKLMGGVDLSTLRVPTGSVMLYGMLNNVWLPGTGFDLRHPYEQSLKRKLPLPAFSGVVAEFVASSSYRLSDRVSYGLMAAPSETNFVYQNLDLYRNGGTYQDTWTPVDNASLLIPFSAISFIGVFGDSVKTTIPSGGYFEQVQNFIVGGGDVASIVDEVTTVRGMPTGNYQGFMRNTLSGQPIADGQIIIYQELELTADSFASNDDYLNAGLRLCATASPNNLCRPYSQDYPDIAGNIFGKLPPGRYAYRVQATGRQLGPWIPFEIQSGKSTSITPNLPPPGWIQAFAVDESGMTIPAKVSVVGQYDRPYSDAERRSGGLFDLQAGDAYRFTDMLPDDVEGQRAYIEATDSTDGTGKALLTVRPGDYIVYFSRGFEYDLVTVPVHVEAGQTATASAKLTRVVDTTGWMSMDTHTHSLNSVDSNLATADRAKSCAGEGLEILISTDHNYVSDFQPTVDALALRPWLTSLVGIEFTTLESGHFNAFPLNYEVGPVTHGAFSWYGRAPIDFLSDLRGLGEFDPTDTDISCNHPRDTIQGYFNQYGQSSLTGGLSSWGMPKRIAGSNGPAFFDQNGANTLSYGFDSIEIFNGKLAHELHSVRVPTNWPAPCYLPLPSDFDPKTQVDPCNLNGKVLRPPSTTSALIPGTILINATPSADPGPSGLDNLEAVFPGAINDWFNLLNQGKRSTGLASSDSHGTVGQEPGSPRTYVYLGQDQPTGLDAHELIDVVNRKHAVTLSNGPFLTFTVAEGEGATGGVAIGSELEAFSKQITINYQLAAPSWVSVNRIQVFVNGRLLGDHIVRIDPNRNLAQNAPAYEGPVLGQIALTLERDSWIVLEAVGDKSMFPVVTGVEEPFLLVSDAVGALAGPLGISASTDIGVVVVGNEPPLAITNPVWVRVTGQDWLPPNVVPFSEVNLPSQDPGVGVISTHN